MAQTRVPYFRSIAQMSNAQMPAYPKRALGLDMLICVGKRRGKDRESLRDRDRNSESDRQTGGVGEREREKKRKNVY